MYFTSSNAAVVSSNSERIKAIEASSHTRATQPTSRACVSEGKATRRAIADCCGSLSSPGQGLLRFIWTSLKCETQFGRDTVVLRRMQMQVLEKALCSRWTGTHKLKILFNDYDQRRPCAALAVNTAHHDMVLYQTRSCLISDTLVFRLTFLMAAKKHRVGYSFKFSTRACQPTFASGRLDRAKPIDDKTHIPLSHFKLRQGIILLESENIHATFKCTYLAIP